MIVEPTSWINSPVMPSEWAQDQRLSYGARGLLAVLVDTVPGGDIQDASESEEILEIHAAELERCGYLVRDRGCWALQDPHPF